MKKYNLTQENKQEIAFRKLMKLICEMNMKICMQH